MKHSYRDFDLDLRETKDGYSGVCNQDVNRQWMLANITKLLKEKRK